MKAVELGLIEPALSCALEIEESCPGVIFTSGYREPIDQAGAMATDVLGDREYLRPGYVYSDSIGIRACYAWTRLHTEATTWLAIRDGLYGILGSLTPEEYGHITHHGKRLAFDIKPGSIELLALEMICHKYDAKLLTKEGKLTRLHVEFDGPGTVCR